MTEKGAKAERVYSIQPRFSKGELAGSSWSMVEGLFAMGDRMDAPYPGTHMRDLFLSYCWLGEPIISGAFAKWVEKASATDWKVIGTKTQADYFGGLFRSAEGGRGWTLMIGRMALNYLTADKGATMELGREDEKSTEGKVADVQHIDATRLVRTQSNPASLWTYLSPDGTYRPVPDANLIQILSMPAPNEGLAGFGWCAMSRLLEAKSLMLGYLTYFRQEIGDLPPELMLIINGLSASKVQASLNAYRIARQQKGLDVYSKIWWLGSDDPQMPLRVDLKNLTSPNKAFNYIQMVEWWVKTIAINTGEAPAEYWLLQGSGNTNTLQNVQALKAGGTGVGKFLQELERQINYRILPYGVLFEFDNTDDEQDMRRTEIVAKNVDSLTKLAGMASGEDVVFSKEEIRSLAHRWGVIPDDLTTTDTLSIVGSSLKMIYEPNLWCANLKETYQLPTTTYSYKLRSKAEQAYHFLACLAEEEPWPLN